MSDLLPLIQRIEVLTLRPDDQLIFTLSEKTTAEQAARFNNEIGAYFPNAIAVVGVTEISVVRGAS